MPYRKDGKYGYGLHNIKVRVQRAMDMDALVEELGDIGVKTKNDHKTEGILEAQTQHLNDMRQLVFKGKQHDKKET